MNRVIIVCCLLFFHASEAFARLLDQASAPRLYLTDLLEIKNNRYGLGCAYSRFPKAERSLQLSLGAAHNPLDSIYSQARAHLYTVQPNDTLNRIARSHTTTIEVIKRLNRTNSGRVKSGQKLWVPDQVLTLEINKTFNRLYVKSGDVLIKEYPVSTGKSAKQTPVGIFVIQSRYPYPTWFHKGTVVSAASPKNFLGSRWLGFDKPQFGIHGTIFPELIGQPASKGCIRMKNEDVEELYDFIPMGTIVVIKEI